jgi:uncharacterized protein YycO
MKHLFFFCNIIILLCLVAVISCSRPDAIVLKEGDIVFQTSKSSQSKYIILATQSQWSHCGIIIEKADGLYVLEAISPVSLTPYQQWVERGRDKRVGMKRYTEEPVKIKYSKYVGKPYDLAFKFGNGKWYCSELVYDIYKRQLGVELCEPRPVSDYAISGLDKVLTKRGIHKNQLVVAPSDLYDSQLLK